MELIFKLFPFDATVICPDANCREKVHGVVLIYGIILLLTAILCFQRSNYRIQGEPGSPPKTIEFAPCTSGSCFSTSLCQYANLFLFVSP